MPHHLHHHDEHTHAVPPHPSHRRKAIAISVVGALVLMGNVWIDHLNREVLLTRDEASSAWGYFHEKALKERIYESELSFAEDLRPDRVASLQKDIARYQSEGAEIRADAEAKEARVTVLRETIHGAELGTVLLELAVILLSVSLIVPFVALELGGGVIALAGLIALVVSGVD